MQEQVFYMSRDFRLIVSGLTVAHTNSASVDISVEAIDVSSYDSGRFKEYIPGDISGSFSSDHFVVRESTLASGETTYHSILESALSNRDTITYVFKTSTSGDKYLTGECVITGLSLSTTLGEKATFSISGNLSGTISIATVGS